MVKPQMRRYIKEDKTNARQTETRLKVLFLLGNWLVFNKLAVEGAGLPGKGNCRKAHSKAHTKACWWEGLVLVSTISAPKPEYKVQ